MARETRASPAGEKKLEKYGVWVKVEPSEVSSLPARETDFELTDLGADALPAEESPQEGALTDEEEKLLDELETSLPLTREELPQDGIPEEESLLADTEEVESLAPIDAELDASVDLEQVSGEQLPDLGDSDVEVPLSDSLPHDETFDDLQALEDELTSAPTPEEPSASSLSDSAEILARIEGELKSIRADLTDLKKELTGLKTTQAETVSEGSSAGAEPQGGFFDEEEDDTIALTGDELDNILNTAEVTEETPGGDEVGEEAPQAVADLSGQPTDLQADILSYDTPLIEEETLAPETEPTVGEPLAEETLADLSSEDAEEVEDLPAELELEFEQEAAAPSEVKEGDLELDLEALPEIELDESAEETPAIASDEAVDLDSLTDIELVPQAGEPQQVEGPAEDLLELESLEEPAAEVTAQTTNEEADLEALPVDAEEAIDLESLPLEGDGLTDLDSLTAESGQSIPLAESVDDLEIGELETVAEEEGPADSEQEIRIDLEEPAEEPAAEEAAELMLEEEPLPEEEETAGEAVEVEDVLELPQETLPAFGRAGSSGIPEDLKEELRTVLKYMDSLLDALPDEKIKEFASSEYFAMYKKLFEELGLGE